MSPERREVLTVCLNPAWQKTLVFSRLAVGSVNRAESLQESAGGKGINAARALRVTAAPVAVALFSGGHTGDLLRRELQGAGIRALATDTGAPTRVCTTLVDLAGSTVTELIEPSAPVCEAHVTDLLAKVLATLPGSAGMALCGTAPPGVPDSLYGQLVAAARRHGVPVLLDTVKDVGPALAAGVDVLKVNAGELQVLSGTADIVVGARRCRQRYGLRWVGVTAGPGAAWLVGTDVVLRYDLPRLTAVRSTIGAGDCTTGVLLERMSAGGLGREAMATGFGDALAAASASCLTDVPAQFDPAAAAHLREGLSWHSNDGG